MGAVYAFPQALEGLTCWAREGCGVHFAVPQELISSARAHQGVIFCPRGHSLGFGKSEQQKAEEALALEKNKTERLRLELEAARVVSNTARKAQAVAQGKLRAQSARIKNGVCPCCKRTFQNLLAHMKGQHPEFAARENR